VAQDFRSVSAKLFKFPDDAGRQTSVIPVMSAISQVRSLASAIQDCRGKANALDWAAWNLNYL